MDAGAGAMVAGMWLACTTVGTRSGKPDSGTPAAAAPGWTPEAAMLDADTTTGALAAVAVVAGGAAIVLPVTHTRRRRHPTFNRTSVVVDQGRAPATQPTILLQRTDETQPDCASLQQGRSRTACGWVISTVSATLRGAPDAVRGPTPPTARPRSRAQCANTRARL